MTTLRGDKQCPHGHTARRKCNDCTHEDDQAEIERLRAEIKYLNERMSPPRPADETKDDGDHCKHGNNERFGRCGLCEHAARNRDMDRW